MENQFKGTQGNWVQNGTNGVHTENGRCVAITHQTEGNSDLRKYDAQLIAAAPDLYRALLKTLDLVNHLTQDESFSNSLVEVIEAKAAIDKAINW